MSFKKLILIMWITNSIICMDKSLQITYKDVILSNLPKEIKDVIKDLAGKKNRSDMQWWYCDKKIAIKEPTLLIKFSKNGKFLALNLNKSVDVLDAEQEFKSIATYKSFIYPYYRRISFDPSSELLLVDEIIDGTRICSLPGKNKKAVDCKQFKLVRFSPDCTIIYKADTKCLWMCKPGQESERILKYKETNYPLLFDCDPKGNFLAISFCNGKIYIIDAHTYKAVFRRKNINKPVRSICFSPCGGFLALLRRGKFKFHHKAGYMQILSIVDVRTGRVKKLWEHLDCSSYAVEYSPCGKFLAISTRSGLEVIDSITGRILSYVAYKECPGISFNPYGTLAVSGGSSSVSLFKYTELTSEQRYFKKLFGAWLCVEKPNKLIKRRYPLFTSMAIRCGISRTVLDRIWETFPPKVQQGILRTMLDHIQFYGK